MVINHELYLADEEALILAQRLGVPIAARGGPESTNASYSAPLVALLDVLEPKVALLQSAGLNRPTQAIRRPSSRCSPLSSSGSTYSSPRLRSCSRRASPSRLAVAMASTAPPTHCPCCRAATFADFWLSGRGWVCGVCHPEPAELAAAWTGIGGAAQASAGARAYARDGPARCGRGGRGGRGCLGCERASLGEGRFFDWQAVGCASVLLRNLHHPFGF